MHFDYLKYDRYNIFHCIIFNHSVDRQFASIFFVVCFVAHKYTRNIFYVKIQTSVVLQWPDSRASSLPIPATSTAECRVPNLPLGGRFRENRDLHTFTVK